jgi:putative heme iron utilization protein
MTRHHADDLGSFRAPGAWRMTGIDPEGCDLVLGSRGLRLPFGSRITSAPEARAELVRLVGVARGA